MPGGRAHLELRYEPSGTGRPGDIELSYRIVNAGAERLMYGETWRTEQRTREGWVNVSPCRDGETLSFRAVTYLLSPGEGSRERRVVITNPRLSAGLYRLVTDVQIGEYPRTPATLFGRFLVSELAGRERKVETLRDETGT